ncbi:hypothetical protein PAL_GLEAN10005972 [Pteropus alecto]|uniref:Uncharacterized protein n=1 Tax=Pteropus alecto TaxID=9402 RepID=L5L7C8_PTEAL|nr:hypothetical protein PAL_GLEAN10005972 [Pteropus alecto]
MLGNNYKKRKSRKEKTLRHISEIEFDQRLYVFETVENTDTCDNGGLPQRECTWRSAPENRRVCDEELGGSRTRKQGKEDRRTENRRARETET